MIDHIYLHGMVFEGRHGVGEDERRQAQAIEVDLDLELDLRAAGASDELEDTVDYGSVFETCRQIVEERSFRLLEGIAETIAGAVLQGYPRVESVKVRAKKPGLPLDGVVEHAGVEIERQR
ncbi:MAG TPA: dihydroneopterin aldolase [Candidatus Limnocylindria bacterium]|nr:dihydroneopterin aldolase [Candidatus Limnocylindria bacterium]